MTEKEKQHAGLIYDSADSEIMEEQRACLMKLYEFNHTRPDETEKRLKLLSEMFSEIGEGCWVEPPLHANWGGHFLHFGKGVYANFNLTLVDDIEIYVGDHTLLGPNVTLAASGHPVLPALRQGGLQFSLPIRIGSYCWLGAGVIVMPGVSIGSGSVIGAGSVVTKDIPANVVAFGNPCRVHRAIDERDRQFYFRDKKIPPELLTKAEKEYGQQNL